MKRLLILSTLVLTGCGQEPDYSDPMPADAQLEAISTSIQVYHDETREVTCWVSRGTYDGGISCLPDSELGGGAS